MESFPLSLQIQTPHLLGFVSEVCTVVFGRWDAVWKVNGTITVAGMQVKNLVAQGGTSFYVSVLSFCANVEVPVGADCFWEGSDRGVTPSKLPKIRNGWFWHRSWRWWVEGDWQEGWRNVISQPEVMFCHQKKAAGGRSFPESWTGILPQTWVLLAPETEPTSSLLCPH